MKTLKEIQLLSQKVRITGFEQSERGQRLQEVGFYKDMIVELFCKMPLAGAMVFKVGTTSIALRQEEAACIFVELLP